MASLLYIKLPWTRRYKGCESSSPNILERYIRNEAWSFKVIEAQESHTKLNGKEFLIIKRLPAMWAKRFLVLILQRCPGRRDTWLSVRGEGTALSLQIVTWTKILGLLQTARPSLQAPLQSSLGPQIGLHHRGRMWPHFQTDSHSITSCVSPQSQWLSPLSRPTMP